MAVLDLLWLPVFALIGALIPTLLIIPLVFIGVYLYRHFQKHLEGWTWIMLVLLVSFILIFIVSTILYFTPSIISPYQSSTPEDGLIIENPIDNVIYTFMAALFSVFLKSLAFTTFTLPFIFVGDYIYDKVKAKIKHEQGWIVGVLAGTYVTVFIFVLISYILPWFYPSLAYMLFFM
ncbi:MAG: hypothetical protein JXA43_03140 [Candidatus Diapherotrites archaeon]|nr:hypothetical protein [Candidatus Diapherotrites archaeon]